jgi:hypothetical protein
LTKYALREFDRRNAKALLHSLNQRAHRPVTRNFIAEVSKLRTWALLMARQKTSCSPNIEPITDNIARAKPNYYYGAQLEQISPDIELSNHFES